jgi:hypothetical protein
VVIAETGFVNPALLFGWRNLFHPFVIELALAIQVAVWLATIGAFILSRQATIFHPVTVYLGFHGLVFVLRPILVAIFGFDSNWIYMQFSPSDETFARTLTVSSAAMISFVLACVYAGRSAVSYQNQKAPSFSERERRALVITTLLFLPLAAYSIYANFGNIGGERINGVYILTNSTGYVNDAQHVIMPLLCLWIVATGFHWLNLIPSLLYVGFRAWCGWSRWTILLFCLMVTITYCWHNRRKWAPLWTVVIAIPVLLLFNLLGQNRDIIKKYLIGHDVNSADYSAGMSAEDRLKKRFDTQDYANFDYLCYVVWIVPERTAAYTYGAQYLQLFTEPIPRILWKGKPIGAPVRTNVDLGAYGNFTGLTVSLAGDGWMSGGWVGLVITLSAVGWLLGMAHAAFWRNIDNLRCCLLYLVGIAMVPQWYRDGGISIAKFLFFNLLPVLIWIALTWLLGKKLVAGYTIKLPPGARVRLLQAGESHAPGFLERN